jgi:hypothetical protein
MNKRQNLVNSIFSTQSQSDFEDLQIMYKNDFSQNKLSETHVEYYWYACSLNEFQIILKNIILREDNPVSLKEIYEFCVDKTISSASCFSFSSSHARSIKDIFEIKAVSLISKKVINFYRLNQTF